MVEGLSKLPRELVEIIRQYVILWDDMRSLSKSLFRPLSQCNTAFATVLSDNCIYFNSDSNIKASCADCVGCFYSAHNMWIEVYEERYKWINSFNIPRCLKVLEKDGYLMTEAQSTGTNGHIND